MGKILSKEELTKLKAKYEVEVSPKFSNWSEKEITILKDLFESGITDARFIKDNNLIPNRTKNSIAIKVSQLRRGEME